MTAYLKWTTALLIVGLVGCGPKPKPLPPPPPPPPPPKPVGDLLRLSGQKGQSEQGKVKLDFENTSLSPNPKKPPRKWSYSFTLTAKHTYSDVDADGTQHVQVELLDVEAHSDNPKTAPLDPGVLAQIMQEAKITFDRSARGEVSKLEVEGGNKPGDRANYGPSITRIVVGSIYGAGRGYVFPERRVEVNNDWVVNTELPIPNGGKNTVELSYHYEAKDGNLATITFDGKTNGSVEKEDAPDKKTLLTGTRKGTLKFDVGSGTLVSQVVDTEDGRSDPGGQPMISGTIAKLHLQWDLQQPAAPAEPTPAPAQQGAPITPLP